MKDTTQGLWQTLRAQLSDIAGQYPRAALASSLAAEDMVLTHAIFDARLPIALFTLDTGRLHPETLALIDTIRGHYGKDIEVWQPDAPAVANHVAEHGAFAFYESVALRKACCQLRKIEPLRRALAGRDAWITGQRREQSATRGALDEHETDPLTGLPKFNPLAGWGHEDVWEVIRHFGIPYNPLHDKGYPSIGCEPCTRAVKPGEDLRAGRWWWETADSRECGLHAGNLRTQARA